MRDPSEMYTASRMQNMVHIGKKKRLVRDQSLFHLFFTFRALGVESPSGGAIKAKSIRCKIIKNSMQRAPVECSHLGANK